LWQGLATEEPRHPYYQAGWGITLYHLAQVLGEPARAEADRLIEQSIEHLQTAVRLGPGNPNSQGALCGLYAARAAALLGRRQYPEAVQVGRRAVAEIEKLVAGFGDVPEFQYELARGRYNLASALVRINQFAEAEQLFRKALPPLQELVDQHGDNPDYQTTLGAVCIGLAVELLAREKRAEGRRLLKKAIEHLELARKHRPQHPTCRLSLRTAYFCLAENLSDHREHDDAAKTLLEYARVFPDHAEEQVETAAFFVRCALRVEKDAELPVVQRVAVRRRFAEQGLALLPAGTGPAKLPDTPAGQARFAVVCNKLGAILSSAGRPEDAATAYGKALPIQEKLVADLSHVAEYQSDLGATLHNLADLRGDRGDFPEARALLERAVRHQRLAWKAHPQNPTYRQFLRNHYWLLADVLVQLKDHAAAARAAGELPTVIPEGGEEYFRAAGFLARCVPLAEKDADLTDARRKELATTYADEALKRLREAVDRGWKNVQPLNNEKTFDSLRKREDFRKLLRDLEGK
jgi:tetratricopeptide (TPR) repeat protein